MSDYEYQKGLDRGRAGASSAHGLFDDLDPFDSSRDKHARSEGYRDGLAAKAIAESIGETLERTHAIAEESYETSGSSGTSELDVGDKILFGAMGLVIGGATIAGGLYGIVNGFNAHGIGGALLFGILGLVGGALAGFVAWMVGVWMLAISAIGAVLWILISLWDLGKP